MWLVEHLHVASLAQGLSLKFYLMVLSLHLSNSYKWIVATILNSTKIQDMPTIAENSVAYRTAYEILEGRHRMLPSLYPVPSTGPVIEWVSHKCW